LVTAGELSSRDAGMPVEIVVKLSSDGVTREACPYDMAGVALEPELAHGWPNTEVCGETD
jgi:hypothetical protein